MSKPNTTKLTADLARLLAQVASLPHEEARSLIGEAVGEAYLDAGCGSRSDLVLACLWLAKEACEAGDADHDDLGAHYASEAEPAAFSDHDPKDAAKWAEEYGEAAAAYQRAAEAVAEAGKALATTLDRIDL